MLASSNRASCSTQTMWRALRKRGLLRKKKVPGAEEQDRPEVQEQRREFREELAGLDPRRLIFMDECGANTAMTRSQGRAPAGQRFYTSTPGRLGVDHADLRDCACPGSRHTLAFLGATNTGIFEAYVEEVLVPELKTGDVVIWDNLKPHQSEEAVEAVETAGREGGATSAVEPGPDADRGDVLESQGGDAVGGGADNGGGLCGVRVRPCMT